MAVNHLADKTPVELRALRGRRYTAGYNGGKPFPYNAAKEVKSSPESFDWRIYGAVNPVKGTYMVLEESEGGRERERERHLCKVSQC